MATSQKNRADGVSRETAARFDDVGAMTELARSCDVVTVEIERIAQEGLASAAKQCPTRPSAHVLSLAQDRRVEKGWLNQNGFQTAPYRIATTLEEMTAAAQAFGACVAKTAREGYDGKGQARLSSAADAPKAWNWDVKGPVAHVTFEVVK